MTEIIVAIIGGVFALIVGFIEYRAKKRETDVVKAIKEYSNTQKLDEMLADIKQLQADLKSLTDESRQNDELLKTAIMHQARDRINQGHRYFMGIGKIDEHSLQSMLSVYESYRALGGNSFIEKEIDDLLKLPIKPLV